MLPFKSFEVVGHKVFNDFYEQLSDDDERKVRIREIIADLKKDINKGRFIKRDKPYPDRYRRLGITNLYVHDIKSDRLIYTIRTDSESKIYQFLDYLSHSEYDFIFHNKKS